MGKAVVLRAWLTFLLATIFFGYAFFQRTAPSAILGDLQREYELDAAGLGALAGRPRGGGGELGGGGEPRAANGA